MKDQEEKDSMKEKQALKVDRPMWAFTIAAVTVVAMFFLAIQSASAKYEIDYSQLSLLSIALQQITLTLFVFVLPAFILSRNFLPQQKDFLKLKQAPNMIMVGIFIGVVFSAGFFLNWLINLNELIPLPDGLAATFNRLQESAEQLQQHLLSFDSFGSLLILIIVMAILPAISEEIFFRGVIQGSLLRTGLDKKHAIIISSLLFALAHFQFYNFFALFFMGAILGTAYHYSKNLWVPIIGHLFNNALIVIVTYLNHKGLVDVDLNADTPFLLSLLALVLFIGLIYMFVVQAKRNKQFDNL